MKEQITIGSRIRAYDFRSRELQPDPSACYVEGVVIKETEDYWEIQPTLRVFDGQVIEPEQETFQRRKNGIPNSWGVQHEKVELLA